MSDNPNEQINTLILPVLSEPRRLIGNPPTVVTATPTTMMPPLFSFLPGLTQPRLSMPLLIESTPLASNITAETLSTDIIRQRTPIPSDTLSSEDDSNGNMTFQVENALAQAETIQREHSESVGRDPITFIPTNVIRNGIPIPNVSLPSQGISIENIIPEEENALTQAAIQQMEHSNRTAMRNVAASGGLITIMPNIG